MVFSSFNNVFRKATPGQRNEQGRAHDIGFPTLINHSASSIENEDTLRVARHKHHRPLPLNLDAQKVMISSFGTPRLHLSESVSSGGTHFEMMSTPSSSYPKLTPPVSDLPSRASPSPSQPEPRGETMKNMTRRRGIPSPASRPSLHHRASSLDSPLPSPTIPQTGSCFPYRKGSSASSALSYSESNASKTIFSPTDPCPSTAYTTPLSSASGSHFHSRSRLFSLEDPVGGFSRSTQAVPHTPTSPKTLLEHRALTPPSPPNASAASLFGINSAPWNVSFSTAPPARNREQIMPDSSGLVLEISQSAGAGSETLLEPVLHKRTGTDLNGKEWVKWEVRLCLPPRRFGSSPAVGFSSPNRMSRSSRTTAPKLSGIGELSTAVLAATPKDHGPPLLTSRKKSLGPRRRGSSLLTSPVHPDPYPASHSPSLASPTRKPVPFSVLVTQASPSSSSPAQGVYRRGGSVFTKPVAPPGVAVAPSQNIPYTGLPSLDFPVEENKKGPEESILKNSPQSVALQLSPSALVARKLAHDKLLGYPVRCPSVESTNSDLGRLSVHSRAPEVSYWSETDASQTEVDDEDEKEEEEKGQVSAGQTAPVDIPDPQEPTEV